MTLSKRIRYFLGHFSCSIGVGLTLLALVFLVWYPAPLAKAEGVTHIFLMLLAIDVTLGPILSLLVYKEGKKTLKMDLAIIILIQLSAMLYGLYSITQSRPVWIVQNGNIFQMVRANAILPEDQKDAKPEYQTKLWTGPQWVAVNQQHAQYQRYAEQTLVPNVYTALSDAKQRIQRNAQQLDALNTFNDSAQVQQVLKQYPNATAWMPLRTTGLGLVVLLDQQQNVVATVDLRPWQE
ncbi:MULTISPECIES: TfpX/TfpZ family type IV pilin accessory protein [unclassified Acinetobacter]|uniref:TfpX/TfpZ family type IV pilin accessory protein n=1 Tax=unclassified Acinetobacter TaxID=196816 RepID=UPI0015D333E9|nr:MULTISPECIES: TfpX/TfpZ family type IV pilin accessory protein [unclassified Acinetobacter]